MASGAGILSIVQSHNEALSLIGLTVGGAVALYRFWAQQSWQRKQFAYDYAEKMLTEPKSMTALHMLDWGSGEISEAVSKEYGLAHADRRWSREDVVRALRIYKGSGPDDRFSRKEYVIRDVFDNCLGKFERMGHFLKSRIISHGDFPTLIAYYPQNITEDQCPELHAALIAYMRAYEFSNALYVFEAFGPAAPRTALGRLKDTITGGPKAVD